VINLVEFRALQAGITPSASTMLTSVKALSLTVCFGANGAMMVPAILKFFPNVEALHITVIVYKYSHCTLILLSLASNRGSPS